MEWAGAMGWAFLVEDLNDSIGTKVGGADMEALGGGVAVDDADPCLLAVPLLLLPAV